MVEVQEYGFAEAIIYARHISPQISLPGGAGAHLKMRDKGLWMSRPTNQIAD